MYTDAGPAFYLEHLKRLRAPGIQPYFTLAHVHQLEIVERLIRHGAYMGPLNTNITMYGGGGCGHNPFDWMHWLQRQPQGAIVTFWAGMRINAVAQPMAIIMGQHVRVGIEDNLWNSKRERMTSVDQIKAAAELCQRFGRKVATAKEAREIMKIGVYVRQRGRDAEAPGYVAEPRRRRQGLHGLGYRRKEDVAASDLRLASDGVLYDASTGIGEIVRSGVPFL